MASSTSNHDPSIHSRAIPILQCRCSRMPKSNHACLRHSNLHRGRASVEYVLHGDTELTTEQQKPPLGLSLIDRLTVKKPLQRRQNPAMSLVENTEVLTNNTLPASSQCMLGGIVCHRMALSAYNASCTVRAARTPNCVLSSPIEMRTFQTRAWKPLGIDGARKICGGRHLVRPAYSASSVLFLT